MPEPTENAPQTVDSYALTANQESNPVPIRSLKRKQIKAAALLGKSVSQKEAARIVRVTEWTMTQWVKIPAFQELVMEHARQDIADIRATKNRSIHKAWDIVETKLDGGANELTRDQVDIARELVRATL